MAVIKKIGAPTRTTKGSVGDTYIDLKTKKAYICASAYRSSTGSADYAWHEKDVDMKEAEDEAVVVEETLAVEPVATPIPEVPVEEEDEAVVEDVKEVKAETPKSSKHDYNKQYRR